MICVIGEILIDLIGEDFSKSKSLSFSIGGAPFNVAYNLSNLKENVTFISSVGDDFFGEEIKKVSHNSLLNLELDTIKGAQTTLAFFIKKDSNDKGYFSFLKGKTSDYLFNVNSLEKVISSKPKLVHFGSLFLRDAEAKAKINDFVLRLKKSSKDTLLTFDVNYRTNIFNDDEYIKIFNEFIKKMDVVKFTVEEILYLSQSSTLLEALKHFSFIKLIFITDGAKGSYSYYKNKLYFKEAFKVSVVNTVGCGDSFFSGVINEL